MPHSHEHPHDHAHEHGHDHPHDHSHEHGELQQCIEECLNCHAVCTMTMQYCLAEGAEKSSLDLVGVLLDCAEMCQTSANFMLRGSPYHALTCSACADICRACEELCRAASDDEQLVHCADVCADCAGSCERMAEAQVDDVAED